MKPGPLAPWLKAVEPGGLQTFLYSDWLILAEHSGIVLFEDSGVFQYCKNYQSILTFFKWSLGLNYDLS